MLPRYSIAAALAAAPFLVTALATPSLAEKKLIASLQGPIETSYGAAFQEMDKCLRERTDGEVFVEIYPDRQLGDLTETFEQVREGTVDMAAVAPGMMAEFMPEIQVFVIPFIFRDFDHWKEIVNGEVGDDISSLTREKLPEIRILGYYGGSVRQLVTKEPVESIDDVQGLVMRLLPSEVLHTAWSAVGASPTVMAYGEVYNGLQLGVIQGLENEPEWIARMKFYEQAPNIALTEHEIVTRPFIFSEKTLQSLPEEQQQAVLECGKVSAEFEQEMEHGLDQKYLKELTDEHGVNVTTIDKAAFAEKISEAMGPFVDEIGLTDLAGRIRQ
ncbi:TRAP transporter substrate-binding protein [Microbaculum marinum]|uniref:TRAP transporter substrate-binding protein n=1 Tax=Microbaculum marinum TaxID=1764581 RepID=A0AAW9S0U7_9HYPH